MFEFSSDHNYEDFFAKIKVIGVGELGAKVINHAIENIIEGVELAVIDTSNETLLKSAAPQRLKINEINSEDSANKIKRLIERIDMIYLIGDLNRKDLTLMIAEQMQNNKILSICLIDSAADEEFIEKLKSLFGTVIISDTADLDLLFQAVRGVTDLVAVPGLVGLDFVDVKDVTSNAGEGRVGYGEASGENAIFKAIKKALQSLKGKLSTSKGILINILGGVENLSMMEVNEATTDVQEAVHEEAEIIWGVTSDDTLEDVIKVVILATKFAEE